MSRLNGRLTRLERTFGPAVVRHDLCPTCGLERNHQWTLDEVRSVVGPICGPRPLPAAWPRIEVGPLCLCNCECSGEHRCLESLTRR